MLNFTPTKRVVLTCRRDRNGVTADRVEQPVPGSRPSPAHARPRLTPVPGSRPSPAHARPRLTPVPGSRPSPAHARPRLTPVPGSRPSPAHARPRLTPVPGSRPPRLKPKNAKNKPTLCLEYTRCPATAGPHART
ncbi:hypothetical protein Bbelb_034360 [Branchiostoma belcheri]|nr:hypothetical protein Bbelb_034360 [Branchiostoma belcheri]